VSFDGSQEFQRLQEVYLPVEGVVIREIAGETLLVPIAGQLSHLQQVFVLDEVAVLVWRLLDGRRSLSQVLATVVGELEVTREEARADLLELVTDLCEARLIQLR
jgi:hypothetical protein